MQCDIAKVVSAVKKTKLDIGISSEFGVVCITKKEALHALSTCEHTLIEISESPGMLVLEYPVDKPERGPREMHDPIPKDFPIQPLAPDEPAECRATCGHCGLSWDDAVSTAWTPTPTGRCPFEYFHRSGER